MKATPLRLYRVVKVFCKVDVIKWLIANKLLQLEQPAYWAMERVNDFTQIDESYKYGLTVVSNL